MTVCIAARVITNNSAIVMCMDMKGSAEWTSAETAYKWVPLRFGFHALMAGTISIARELVQACAEAIDAPPATGWEVIRALRRGIGMHKRAMADTHLQRCLGMGYEDFREEFRSTRDDFYRELWHEVKNQRSQVHLIVCGFVGRTPMIFKIGDDAVSICDHFAAIGTGGYLAEAALFQRSQNLNQPLSTTVYQVYEAKRLAEKADAVGELTRMVIIWQDGRTQYVKEAGFQVLREAFARCSLQPVSSVGLPEESFGVVAAG